MKSAPILAIKKELQTLSTKDLMSICLNLAKYKKDNKDYLSYLLFDSDNRVEYLNGCKDEMEHALDAMTYKTFYHKKKAIRAVLKKAKTRIRYTSNKEFEVDLLLYFCECIANQSAEINRNHTILGIVERQLIMIKKIVAKMHEDLQYDYNIALEELEQKINL